MKKLILFELRKVFSKRLALIALIGIILFSALLSFTSLDKGTQPFVVCDG